MNDLEWLARNVHEWSDYIQDKFVATETPEINLSCWGIDTDDANKALTKARGES